MGTLAAKIDSTGISAPSQADILTQLQNQYRSIYGADVDLDPDTQDGQLLGIFSQAISDCNQTAIDVYNAFAPQTAQGVSLDRVVKVNGIVRQASSLSEAIVSVGGVVGTDIINGIIGDNLGLGTQWTLPASVVIPDAGTIDVTATCTTDGAVAAGANSLTKIITPTLGWQTVNNAAAATPGAPIETDAALRQRQAKSTSLPAETILDGIFAAVANVTNVGRLAIYENDSDITDGNGIPSHSISVVVSGGDIAQVAAAIALKKAPGTGTYGSTSVVVIDSRGVPNTIRFYELAAQRMTLAIQIHPLAGYVSTTGDLLKAVVAAFLTQLAIGEKSYLNRLWGPANLMGDVATGISGQTQAQLDALSNTYNVNIIQQSIFPTAPAAADVAIAFNQAAVCVPGDIALTTV